MRISDWSSDVCSSDLLAASRRRGLRARVEPHLCGGDRAICEDAGGRARVGPCDPGRSGGRPPIPNHLLPRRASPVGTRPVAPCQAAFAERSAGSQVQYRSEEHTSELQSLMRISYAVFCLKKNKEKTQNNTNLCTIKINSTTKV